MEQFGAKWLVEALKANGVTHVFGLLGCKFTKNMLSLNGKKHDTLNVIDVKNVFKKIFHVFLVGCICIDHRKRFASSFYTFNARRNLSRGLFGSMEITVISLPGSRIKSVTSPRSI